MAFFKKFIGQQSLFLFSKHLDTMLNLTHFVSGETDPWPKFRPIPIIISVEPYSWQTLIVRISEMFTIIAILLGFFHARLPFSHPPEMYAVGLVCCLKRASCRILKNFYKVLTWAEKYLKVKGLLLLLLLQFLSKKMTFCFLCFVLFRMWNGGAGDVLCSVFDVHLVFLKFSQFWFLVGNC